MIEVIRSAFYEKQKTSFYHCSLQTDTFNVHIFFACFLYEPHFLNNFRVIVIVTFSFK